MLVSFEMSYKMGQGEVTWLSKGMALTCEEYKKMKGKKQNESSTSSSEYDDGGG